MASPTDFMVVVSVASAAGELLEREPGGLDDHVVERGLEARRGHAGDVVGGDLVEAVAERELGGELGDREAGRLRRQRRGARHAGGFISITMTRPFSGFTANWMLQPPVSTPTARMMSMPMLRRFWYSRSVSVSAGATVIESPVCTPTGVDVLDRAHHDGVVGGVAHELELVLLPAEDRLLQEHLGGRRVVQARPPADAAQVLLVEREAGSESAHRERGAHDQRVAELLAPASSSSMVWQMTDAATSAPASSTSCLKICRSSPFWMASTFAPMSSTPYFSRIPRSWRAIAALSAVWPPRVGRIASGFSLAMIVSMTSGGDRLDVRGVGEVRVGHDRGRVGVDEDDADALLAEHPAGLGAGVVELAGLTDDDGGAGSDDEDGVDVVALGHYLLSFFARWATTTSRKRSKR